MSNQQLTQAPQRQKFSAAITSAGYQQMIKNTLGDPDRAKRFVSTITSAVAVNPALQECDAKTILSAALLGESLNLSPSPQLGQFYLVPFKKKDRQGNVVSITAQFVLGYKGMVQLAQRSGQLKKLNVIEIKEGELRSFDPLNEEINAVLIEDLDAREDAETIGYYAFYELQNGFRKAIYWSRKQMERHAKRFSAAYAKGWDSIWKSDFDSMAKKTMLRQLISKGGCPMSTEMAEAVTKDGAIGTVDFSTGEVIAEPVREPEFVPQAKQELEAPPEVTNGDGQQEMSLDDF